MADEILHEDPRIVFIDGEMCQEFRGKVYRASNGYFVHKGKYLSRDVWESSYGPIPPGYEIHHKDNNHTNNALGNLDCVTVEEHRKFHTKHKALARRVFWGGSETSTILRAFRAKHDITQAQAAELIGISITVLQQWEGGVRRANTPAPSWLPKLMRYIEIDGEIERLKASLKRGKH